MIEGPWLGSDQKMKIRFDLPKDIHGVRYVVNSHFMEIEDKDGHVARLLPTGLVKYRCEDCGEEFMMTSNHGDLTCPICGARGQAKPCWGRVQLSFVPENESDFDANRRD